MKLELQRLRDVERQQQQQQQQQRPQSPQQQQRQIQMVSSIREELARAPVRRQLIIRRAHLFEDGLDQLKDLEVVDGVYVEFDGENSTVVYLW